MKEGETRSDINLSHQLLSTSLCKDIILAMVFPILPILTLWNLTKREQNENEFSVWKKIMQSYSYLHLLDQFLALPCAFFSAFVVNRKKAVQTNTTLTVIYNLFYYICLHADEVLLLLLLLALTANKQRKSAKNKRNIYIYRN